MGAEHHVALLVEDDPGTAEQVKDLLSVLGIEYRHAATQQHALELVEQGGFCIALLDLQIKRNEDSIMAHLEAGQSVLDAIRAKYGEQNRKKRMHWLPVVIMTGFAKETEYVVEMMRRGADDYEIKPFAEMRKLADKIRDALERSERAQHTHCEEASRRARGASANDVVRDEPKGGAMRLSITGARRGKRSVVLLDDREVLLPNSALVIALHLVAGRMAGGDGWVHRSDMGAREERGWKGISRLRQECAFASQDLVENDGSGRYRLAAAIKVAELDLAALRQHDEAKVRELAGIISSAH